MHTGKNGKKIAAAQSEHYAYRAEDLYDLYLDEFIMAMHLERQVAPDKKSTKNETANPAGRHRDTVYPLLSPHPLHDSYVVKQKTNFDVLILVGEPPPRELAALPPGKKVTPSRRRRETDSQNTTAHGSFLGEPK